GRFHDATAEAGLAGLRPSLGVCVADVDNDGRPDLILTGPGDIRLLRNAGGKFEDVTAAAGLDKFKGVCLSAAVADLDQDGDLDLILPVFAQSVPDALARLNGQSPPGGGLAVFLNVGEAKPGAAGLTIRFQPFGAGQKGFPTPRAAAAVAVTDADGDHDLDLIVPADGQPPAAVLNDRLLSFHRPEGPAVPTGAGRWTGALVLDAGHNGRADLLLLAAGAAPVLALNPGVPDRHRPAL